MSSNQPTPTPATKDNLIFYCDLILTEELGFEVQAAFNAKVNNVESIELLAHVMAAVSQIAAELGKREGMTPQEVAAILLGSKAKVILEPPSA